jgi:hypothetical protein
MKIFLISLFTVLTISLSQAQTSFHFGPRIGYQFSTFTGEKHTAYQPGFYGGGFAKYSFNTSLEVEMDLLYSETGGSRLTYQENPPGLDDPISRVITTSHTSLKGLEIPLLAHYAPWTGSAVKPFFSIGPSLGILFYGRAKQDITLELNPSSFPPIPDPIYGSKPIVTTASGRDNVTSEYKRLNLGGVLGAGLDIPFTRFTLRLDLRYRRGLTPVDTSYNPLNLASNSSNLKSNSFALSAGIIF